MDYLSSIIYSIDDLTLVEQHVPFCDGQLYAVWNVTEVSPAPTRDHPL